MKAVIITRPGAPEVLEVQERPKPEPGVGQIRVRVRASALNRADLMQREGNYPVPAGVTADISGMEYKGAVVGGRCRDSGGFSYSVRRALHSAGASHR